MRAVVVAGSLARNLDEALISSADLIVAVDGGADTLARVNVVPHVLVGDLDSISRGALSELELRGVEVMNLSRFKDETDTEAALKIALERGADWIIVYGALGGPRYDHLLGNLLLLTAPWLEGTSVRLVDDRHEAFLAKGDATFFGMEGNTVSLLPLSLEVEQVRTEGLLYPLHGETLHQGSTRSVSNAMTGIHARVTHGAGRLLIVRYYGR
jgi:thiamine pyrophosphokinase